MAKRTGEKIGWIGGWGGGFLWVLILSIVWLVKGKGWEAFAGIILVLAAAALILALAPWRHPSVPYWKLMVPLYLLFFLSAGWAFRSFGEGEQSGFSGWSLVPLVILLLPFWNTGRRRWKDGER